MQLLIILALLLYGGKTNAGNIISEVKPMLESIGGEDMKQALKSAEEITQVLSAVQSMAALTSPSGNFSEAPPQPSESFSDGGEWRQGNSSQSVAFPLSPISAIADRDITYSLSKYISQN